MMREVQPCGQFTRATGTLLSLAPRNLLLSTFRRWYPAFRPQEQAKKAA